MGKYDETSSIIVGKLYPIVAKSLDKNTTKFKKVISEFITNNSQQMYDIAPYDIIYYRDKDKTDLFTSLGLTEKDVIKIMEECFYWKLPFNPQAAKEPYVLVCMAAIRYFLLHKKEKDAEITAIYLAFSGKLYASVYSGIVFTKAPPSKYRAVMDYVINNMINDKFDLRVYGNMFGAIKHLCVTWLNKYGPILCGKPDDKEVANMIQQMRDRERSFLMNIAKLYYDAYENKQYLNYETDSLSDNSEFRITDNDSLRATRFTENTVSYLMNNSVSLKICNECKDENIKTPEIKNIMESILADNANLDDIYRVVNILICDFMSNNPGKRVGSVEFIAHSIRNKPNVKDKYLVELKQIIVSWLDENSPNFRKRKSRAATASSYYKAVLKYFTLVITLVVR